MGCQHGKGQGEAGNWSVNLLIQTDTDAHQPMTSQFADLMSPVVSSSPNTPVTRGKLCTRLLLAPHSSPPHTLMENQEKCKTPGYRKMLMVTLTGGNRVGEMELRQTEPNLPP